MDDSRVTLVFTDGFKIKSAHGDWTIKADVDQFGNPRFLVSMIGHDLDDPKFNETNHSVKAFYLVDPIINTMD